MSSSKFRNEEWLAWHPRALQLVSLAPMLSRMIIKTFLQIEWRLFQWFKWNFYSSTMHCFILHENCYPGVCSLYYKQVWHSLFLLFRISWLTTWWLTFNSKIIWERYPWLSQTFSQPCFLWHIYAFFFLEYICKIL